MKIAICGCGIGGLATAIFARRAGFDITIFDQFNTPGTRWIGAGHSTRRPPRFGTTWRGRWRVGQGGQRFPHDRPRGHQWAQGSGRCIWPTRVVKTSGWVFIAPACFNAMLDVAIADGISITANHKITSTHTTDAGRFVTFENDTVAGPFDLVVDTTGASSPISSLISKPLPYGAIWGTVDWPEKSPLQYDRLQQRYRRASNMIGILPIGTLPNGSTPKAALFWSMPRGRDQKLV